MSLERYEDVLPWAAGIQREVLERRMPPWSPEEGHLAYRGERLLSALEIDVLADWIAGATPAGDPDPGTGTEPTDIPRVGPVLEDDGVVTLRPAPVVLGPNESLKTECRVVSMAGRETTWVTGIDLRAGAPRSLRRAVLWKGDACDAARAPLFAWVPGLPPMELPAGSGEALAPGQALALRLEYRKTWDDDGLEVIDASGLRLRLGARGRALLRKSADGTPLAVATSLVALVPVAVEGGTIEVVAERPGREPSVVLELRAVDPLWLGRYELVEPLALPVGSAVRARGGRVFVELVTDP